MARQRFIWPSIWADPEFGRLPAVAQVFFIGCFSNADDEGRLFGDAAYLRSTIWPYQSIALVKVRETRDLVVERCHSLHLYELEGIEYLAFLKWTKYQKPKYPRPSEIPPPFPESSGNPSEALAEGFRPGLGLGREDPPNPPSGGAWIPRKELRKYTGCRVARGSHGSSFVLDPLGTDKPPADWPHEKPSATDVAAALALRNGDA